MGNFIATSPRDKIFSPATGDRKLSGARAKIAGASPAQHPRVFAEAGLWYDALASIERARERAGDKPQLMADCRSLLDDEALEDVTCPGRPSF